MYAEMFTPFLLMPDPDSRLYSVTRMSRSQHPVGRVDFLQQLHFACHLSPNFGNEVPARWTSDNVLDESGTFVVTKHLCRRIWALHEGLNVYY